MSAVPSMAGTAKTNDEDLRTTEVTELTERIQVEAGGRNRGDEQKRAKETKGGDRGQAGAKYDLTQRRQDSKIVRRTIDFLSVMVAGVRGPLGMETRKEGGKTLIIDRGFS